MNGWLRLWVVLSVIWLVSSGYITYDNYQYRSISKITVFSYTDDNGKIQKIRVKVATLFGEIIEKDLVEASLEKAVNLDSDFISEPYDLHMKNVNKDLRNNIIRCLAPVFSLLIFGYAIAWIRAGFRKKILAS